MPKPKIIVERIPLEYRPVDIAPNFPPMPVLYLELIENKDKVKPELRDKASQPIFLPEKSPSLPSLNHNLELVRKERTPEIYKPPVIPPVIPPSPKDLSKDSPSPESLIHSRLKERLKGARKSESREKSPIIQDHRSIKERRQEDERDREKYRDNVDRIDEPRRDSRRAGGREDGLDSRHAGGREDVHDSRHAGGREDVHDSRHAAGREDGHDSRHAGGREDVRDSRRAAGREEGHDSRGEKRREEGKYDEEKREKSNSETKRIRSILGNSGAAKSVSNVQSIPLSNALPPSIEQITSNEPIRVQGKQVKDVTYTSQDEIERRRDLMFRFDILKKSYKDASIPEISQFMDLETLDRIYQDTVRRVALDSKVEGYRRFLNMGFMGMELLFSNILKIDITGFAKQQMASMNSYEKILIELGEKSLLDKTKSQWPAEVRLLFTIVMNAVIFVMTKAIMGGGLFKAPGAPGAAGGGGGGGMGAIGGLVSGLMGAMGGGGMGGMGLPGQSSAQAAQASEEVAPEPPKATGRKMRGPSTINLDDLGSKKTN